MSRYVPSFLVSRFDCSAIESHTSCSDSLEPFLGSQSDFILLWLPHFTLGTSKIRFTLIALALIALSLLVQASVETSKCNNPSNVMSSNSEEIERLRAENERLRAQVENAARYGVIPSLHPTQADIAEEQKLETDIIAEALSTKAFTIVVLGASGDLAKKKTYPALFALFRQGLIPPFVTVCGFSRTAYTDVEFRTYLDTNVLKGGSPEHREAFLARCVYFQGHYDSSDSYAALHQRLLTLEAEKCGDRCDSSNRIFYFAIPPSIYADVANAMRPAALTTTGFNRLIVEKPFGRDLQSFASLNETLMSNFTEDQIYRIDHYLGKEMVQNIMTVRFANGIFEPLWNRHHVQSVVITFKEDLDLQGRGGYFDQFGIIRDVMQNHLTQVLSLVAMEPPTSLSAEDVRDEKVKVLKSIAPLTLDRLVVGQFVADPNNPAKGGGYLDDPTVPGDSITPTYAAAVFYVDNARWDGVPFVLKCGKGLDERKAEIRIRFKDVPGPLYRGSARANELVLRVQPNEAMWLKLVTKRPGLLNRQLHTELDLTYKNLGHPVLYDAYERLLLDCVRGDRSLFVRNDELDRAWQIFTPALHRLEKERIRPVPYVRGIRSPPEADLLLARAGIKIDGAGTDTSKTSRT